MVQTALPTATVSNDWTVTGSASAHAALASASDSSLIETATEGDLCRVNIASLTDPAVSTGHIIRFRAQATGSGGPERIVVRLFEGGTQRAVSTAIAITRSSFNAFSYTLDGTETDSITDYTDLRIEIDADTLGAELLECSEVFFEVPDAGLDLVEHPDNRTEQVSEATTQVIGKTLVEPENITEALNQALRRNVGETENTTESVNIALSITIDEPASIQEDVNLAHRKQPDDKTENIAETAIELIIPATPIVKVIDETVDISETNPSCLFLPEDSLLEISEAINTVVTFVEPRVNKAGLGISVAEILRKYKPKYIKDLTVPLRLRGTLTAQVWSKLQLSSNLTAEQIRTLHLRSSLGSTAKITFSIKGKLQRTLAQRLRLNGKTSEGLKNKQKLIKTIMEYLMDEDDE